MARILVILFFSFAASARDLDKEYEKVKMAVGPHKIEAYVADNQAKRSEGLMFIKTLPPQTGMLFVFDYEEPLAFWMKNTLMALSIGYFDSKGLLVDVQEMKVLESIMVAEPPSYRSKSPALFALEMPSGWFTKNKVKVGAKLELLSTTRSALLRLKLPNAKPARH